MQIVFRRVHFISHSSQSLQGLFKDRRLFYQSTSALLAEPEFLSRQNNVAAYCGYDPTAGSLHIGNLPSIVMMARLAMFGFKPIFLLGGATGLIGDPSGKNKQRLLLDRTVVRTNISKISQQIASIYNNLKEELVTHHAAAVTAQELDNFCKSEPLFVDNYEFYTNSNPIQFLRDVGKHFRMNALINRDIIASRINSEEGISFTEFSYSLIQAADFETLNTRYNCILQIGGSDQWGNIINGCELVRKKHNREVYGITMPLLLDKSGNKFGKSQGNALHIDEEMTPKHSIYQYLLNVPDSEVADLLRIYTFYSEQSIQAIMAEHCLEPQARKAQKTLAQCLLRILGGYKSLNDRYFRLSNEEIRSKDLKFMATLFQDIQQKEPKLYFRVPLMDPNNCMSFYDFLLRNGLASKEGLQHNLSLGGFYINNRRMLKAEANEQLHTILQKELLYERYVLLRWGKKKYQFLDFCE